MMHLKTMKLITAFIVLVASTFVAANAVATDRPENTGTTEIPQGLWEAFSRARLLIEPVKNPSIGARFAGQNPANGLHFLLDEKGVTFRRGSDWSLGMQLEFYGTTSSQQAYATQRLHLDGNTVTLDRGDIQEWYVNRAQGLEQGFTLANKPTGHTPGQDIVLTIRLSGDLEPRLQNEGQKIAFYARQTNYAFSYAKLLVVDANGKGLPAKMLLAQGQLQIQFDPTGAQWPVTVDPVVSVETKLVGADADAANLDYFGTSVALFGDTALIGSPNDDDTAANSGSAYVFVHTGSSWVFQGKLTATDAAKNDYFGYSVALSADTALIGAYKDDCSGGALDCGAAYVFTRSGSVWSQQAKLTTTGLAENDFFGNSVALSGNTALIGADQDNCSAGVLNCGSVYVFTGSGTSWALQQKLMATVRAANDYFGNSVALSVDTALIGAYKDDCSGGTLDCGSAYVFTRSGTVWSQQKLLTATAPAKNDHFGNSVALSGNTALIGADQDSCSGGAVNCGSAYVFTGSGTSWALQHTFTASVPAADDHFGYSVALSADTALIGAYQDDDSGTDSGSAYVFTRSGTTWSSQQKLTASDAAIYDYFGYSVALSADIALIGAYGADCSAGGNCGSAYAYIRSGSSWSQQQKFTAVDQEIGSHFGTSVALSADTALIGASDQDCSAGLRCGAAYVFVRSGGTWTQQQKLTASDAAAGDLFGISVSLSANTALIGAKSDDCSAGGGCGAAYVFTRTGSIWSPQQKLTATVRTNADYFGNSVALSADTALIGASLETCSAGLSCGAAYVFTRAGSIWSQQQKLTATVRTATDYFGGSVALSVDTALIGANYSVACATGSTCGVAYVFTRSGSNWSLQQKLTATGPAVSDHFGYSVALSENTALIGAYGVTCTAGAVCGSAYVFTRNGSTWSKQQILTASDAAAGEEFGSSVALSADTALIGAPQGICTTGVDCGTAYVYIRTGNSWSQQQKLSNGYLGTNDKFGGSVALSSDTALIGAVFVDCTRAANCGAAYLYNFPCGYGKGLLANRWTMIGIPCDPGAANTVQDIFDQMDPSRYFWRWVVYKRDTITDAYSMLDLTTPMTLSEGYWIFSLDATVWDVSGTETPRVTSEPNCLTPDGCYVINLTPPGAGLPRRFNLIGHVFSFAVDWASVRVDVNGTAYTPSGAKAAGYMEKEMWIYNGNGYDVFDDGTPGMEGTLTPQGGIWVAVLNGAAGMTIKLLIPVRNATGSPPPPPTFP